MPHKNDVLRDHNAVSGNIKTVIPFVVKGIADKDTPGATRSKLMRDCRGQVGVAGTLKDPEIVVGMQCVVEGGVRAGDSDGFCWKTVQQIYGSVEALYPILWWHGCLKQ
jgi:hypothetical protein